MKFTFKRDERWTGLASVGQRRGADVKLKGRVIGRIDQKYDSTTYRVRFMFKRTPTADRPAPFEWQSLTRTFESEEQARVYLNERVDQMVARWGDQFYFHEED